MIDPGREYEEEDVGSEHGPVQPVELGTVEVGHEFRIAAAFPLVVIIQLCLVPNPEAHGMARRKAERVV
jgi:hypothetical protein